MKLERPDDAVIHVRTTVEVKDRLRELSEILGKEYGTRISQTQALEMAIAEALSARKSRT